MNDPKYWHQPEKYLPERFDRTSAISKCPFASKRPDCAFIPFVYGERRCFGNDFAMHAQKVIVSAIISHFNVESGIPVDTIKPVNDLTNIRDQKLVLQPILTPY